MKKHKTKRNILPVTPSPLPPLSDNSSSSVIVSSDLSSSSSSSSSDSSSSNNNNNHNIILEIVNNNNSSSDSIEEIYDNSYNTSLRQSETQTTEPQNDSEDQLLLKNITNKSSLEIPDLPGFESLAHDQAAADSEPKSSTITVLKDNKKPKKLYASKKRIKIIK